MSLPHFGTCSRCGVATSLYCTWCYGQHERVCGDGEDYELWCHACIEYLRDVTADIASASREEEAALDKGRNEEEFE